MTPLAGQRTEKSWHFDVSNEQSVRSSRSPQKVKKIRESWQPRDGSNFNSKNGQTLNSDL
jgi:hypothetical protein